MKEEKFEKALLAIFELLTEKGVSGISHTAVARISGLSRAWVYKYVGKSNQDLIHFVVDQIAKKFVALGEFGVEKNAQDLSQNFRKGSINVIERVKEKPGIAQTYFNQLCSKSLLSNLLREWDGIYLKNVGERIETHTKRSREESEKIAEALLTIQMAFAYRNALHPNSKNKTASDWMTSLSELGKIMNETK